MNSEKLVTRGAFVRDITDDQLKKREVEFVISSEAVDSYGTVFKMAGWQLDSYRSNPIVCYQHRAHSDDPDNVIGVSTVRKEDDKLIGTVTFEDAEINPRAEKIYKKVLAGTLRMASIGASVEKAHFGLEEAGEDPEVLYFDRSILREWSIVTVGANPDAHKRNAQTIDSIKETLIKGTQVIGVEDVKNTNRSVQEAQIIINKNKSI